MENISEDYKKWMVKGMHGKLKEQEDKFIKCLINYKEAEDNGYKPNELYGVKSAMSYIYHINSNSNGYWEGFKLIASDTGYSLSYIKKLDNLSKNLELQFKEVKTFEEVLKLQEEAKIIGLQL